MEITTRKEAISKGQTTYFTGIPCRNNHLTYRYTQSGTCSLCVRSYSGSVELLQQRQQLSAQRQELAERLQRMVQFRSRLFGEDLGIFSEIVLAAAQAREPGCVMRDVWRGGLGTSRMENTAVHIFSCFAEDLPNLREMALAFFNQRRAPACVIVSPPIAPEPAPAAEYWPDGDPR